MTEQEWVIVNPVNPRLAYIYQSREAAENAAKRRCVKKFKHFRLYRRRGKVIHYVATLETDGTWEKHPL